MQLMRVVRHVLFLATVLMLSACGILSSGESVAYHVWNHDRDRIVFSPTLEGGGNILDGGVGSRRSPRSPTSNGWDGSGGNYFPLDTGHHIPERAKLTWYLPAKGGQEEWQGDLVGPFDVDIRTRIPERVLKRIRGNRDALLAIGVSVGMRPIKLRWILKEANFVDGKRQGGWRNVEHGGDW